MIDVTFRAALPQDVEMLHRFVVELAEDEDFPSEVSATPDDLARALFGSRPMAEAVIAEAAGEPVGFAVYYLTYSTILGMPTLHLEDLYVETSARSRGIGLAMLRHLARAGSERGCGRFEWWVLRTNEAAIRFYTRLGARKLSEIDVMRVDGPALDELASQQ